MKKILTTICLLILLAAGGNAQEILITDFPMGKSSSVGDDFFQPYFENLSNFADSLNKYPELKAVILGSADGNRFKRDHDSKNPGLALGRAHALRNFMVEKFGINPDQLLIESIHVKALGIQFRSASIRLDWSNYNFEQQLGKLSAEPKVEQVIQPPQEIIHNTYNSVIENLGLQISAGVSTSPFGGIPIIAGSVNWKRQFYAEAVFGHTFWDGNYKFKNFDLDTKRRMAGFNLLYYPDVDYPLGIVGGWMRVEDISQKYYEYVQLSEGIQLGLRWDVLDYLAITGTYNPAKHRKFGYDESESKNDQFMLSVTLFQRIGGGQ